MTKTLIARKTSNRKLIATLAVAALALALATYANAAAKEKVLYSFAGGSNAATPWAALVFDSAGNLYGTTEVGGMNGDGTVFMLTPGSNGTWTETILYSFGGTQAPGNPLGNLIFDANGNLYSTLNAGNPQGGGAVFELSPGSGGTWSETTLVSFESGSTIGAYPFAGLIFDSTGNLYGTTAFGGKLNGCTDSLGCGTVFELAAGTETVLHTFTGGSDGAQPFAGLISDSAGNLYGTASAGGNVTNLLCQTGYNGRAGCGVVFKLTKGSAGRWTETVLHTFTGGNDGANPTAGLIFDSAGNLYGTAQQGGSGSRGVVFKLTLESTGRWTETVVHSFTQGTGIAYAAGSSPYAGVIFDTAGNLYGTTLFGGTNGNGVVFKLTPGSTGRWTEAVLHSFGKLPSTDGEVPNGGLILDSVGNLYGTTYTGGQFQQGTVYEITP